MVTTPDAPPWLYPTERFAPRVGMPLPRLRRQIRAGRIRAVRIGRRLYVPASELDRLLSADDDSRPTIDDESTPT